MLIYSLLFLCYFFVNFLCIYFFFCLFQMSPTELTIDIKEDNETTATSSNNSSLVTTPQSKDVPTVNVHSKPHQISFNEPAPPGLD